jgi:PHD/YefM family antitoxin component YafN of YafNO toxin-antitoxin module
VVQTLSITEAREQLTRLPEQLAEEGNLHAVAVTRHGKPILAVLPWELYESLIETLEVLGDAEQMQAFRQGAKDFERGSTTDWAEVKARLDLE